MSVEREENESRVEAPTLTTRVRTAAASVGVYDLVLAVIPLVLTGGALVGTTGHVSFTAGTAGGSLAGAVLVWYAVFGIPPGYS
ncbi:hypothetical protein [Halarchaeum sp. P4]|uniref:hypothetical protein n=1 Tax=Halarchaeum sp. P4 TaxID=3421639 RepID=UPI003EBD838A